MKIARLLEIHNQNPHEQGLPLNLGDGYLIKNNILFAAVRKGVTTLNYKYSTDMSPSYLALPLSQLESILKTKTIPYIDNVSVLKEVESKIRNTTEWDEVTDNLKRNQLFHESCHAIVRHFSDKLYSSPPAENEKILKTLIEESFSNSCELLGIADAEDPVHRLFYEINSYIFLPDQRSQMKKVIAELGYSVTLKFLVLAYLSSNFLREKLSDQEFNRLLCLAQLQKQPQPMIKILRSLSKIAFELNPRFRWVTTTFYLRLHGKAISTEQLARIDFISILESNPLPMKLIELSTKSLHC